MTFAADAAGVLDPRHSEKKSLEGYGIALYWETLARWIPQRALRDARAAGAPIVFLQAVDECNSIGRDEAARLLNVVNMHQTADIHEVFPAHVGMRVKLTKKLNGTLGLVQEEKATIVASVFHE